MADFLSPVFPKKVSTALQKALGIKAMVAVPVQDNGGPNKGVILFISDKLQTEVGDRDYDLMSAMSNHMRVTIENVHLYQTVQEQLQELAFKSDQLSKANVQLVSLDKAKSEFISIASHQLRTPLTVIKGYCQLLLDDMPVEDRGRRKVEKIAKATQSAASLTQQLLAFSRRQVLLPEVISLNDVVGEMSVLFWIS